MKRRIISPIVKPASASAHWFAAAAVALLLGLASHTATAGLSSENVVVVVNGNSLESRTVANHYIHLRQIPSKNVVFLDDVPEEMIIDLDPFRERILRPILRQLDARKIATQVRVIAYSAGFPTAVRIPEHRDKLQDETLRKYQRGVGSITGLTYFYRFVLGDQPGYLGLSSNLFARAKFERNFINPFGGERKSRFDEASKLFDTADYAGAIEIWQELFTDNPVPGLAIRLAEAYSLDGNDDKAVEMIRAAFKAGWWSASYLEQTPALQKHLGQKDIAAALPYLDDSPIIWQGPSAFSGAVGWSLAGSPVPIKKGGIPYLCACSLAVVNQRGSTVEQAVGVLKRAAEADRTFPVGRFAFSSSQNIRAKTRFPAVAGALLHLQANGHETEVFRGNLPTQGGPIAGLMTGFTRVELEGGPWNLVPGAIAENLTSYGGIYDRKASHTRITDFLHAGACMSSGAVEEPFSLPYKFPSPMLYAFYAQGLSAIESFYQSIASPYQLLIVGDPLTQPFARAPDETIEASLFSEGERRVRLTRRTLGLKVPKSPTKLVEVSINGRRVQNAPPVPNIDIRLPEDGAGVLDVRATLVGLDRTEPRLSFVTEVDLAGEQPTPTATILKTRSGIEGDGDIGSAATAIEFELSAEGADQIALTHLGVVVATLNADQGKVTVETKELGGGPLRFRPIATYGKKVVLGRTLYDEPGNAN
ncbi:MAG: hypothetical protein AAFU85_02085 [Planctomycetota bacterium]